MKSSPCSAPFLALPGWIALLLAASAGVMIPLGLAPFNLWPLSIVGLTLLALLLDGQAVPAVLQRSFAFGAGMYGVGVSWIYVSIHNFGGASILLAGFLTLLFVMFIAAMFTIPFYVYGRWFSRYSTSMLLAFPACWLLGEWFRYWFLTGFPWLYPGYGHLHTPLAGWAPIVGVMGVGFILVFTAGVTAQWIKQKKPSRSILIASVLMCSLWGTGEYLKTQSWTTIDAKPINVAMIQPNIAQEMKWQAEYAQPTLDLLQQLSADAWDDDWIIWPEAAIPLTYNQALPFLNEMNQRAADTHTGLVTGIIYDDQNTNRYFNSIAGFGDAMGMYHKRRLVPFGEYVPLEDWLRGLIQFFNLPTSIISMGPDDQRGISINGISVAPAVCYELVYPDLFAQSALDANVLLTISNLGWFGDSIGPRQFMQMAQMRALETGRYLVYSTNNGSSAFINERGEIINASSAFTTTTLEGKVYSASGVTPFMRWGSPWLALLSSLLLMGLWMMHRRMQQTITTAGTSAEQTGETEL